ncbi:YciI family protein [Rhodococcus opacus]|uniref:YciI family protein n=1 Tax=Rhodococcus opacus TaxID=37919 RepID=UPI001C473CC3|nr:hypothetical protein [Rhodococcus opacus]
MYVCTTTYLQPLEHDDPVLQRHWDYLDACYQVGTLVCSGPKHSREGGVLVIRATTAAAAHDVMNGDPLVVEGRIIYHLIGFTPTRAHTPQLIES